MQPVLDTGKGIGPVKQPKDFVIGDYVRLRNDWRMYGNSSMNKYLEKMKFPIKITRTSEKAIGFVVHSDKDFLRSRFLKANRIKFIYT